MRYQLPCGIELHRMSGEITTGEIWHSATKIKGRIFECSWSSADNRYGMIFRQSMFASADRELEQELKK